MQTNNKNVLLGCMHTPWEAQSPVKGRISKFSVRNAHCLEWLTLVVAYPPRQWEGEILKSLSWQGQFHNVIIVMMY